jgi:hypothetical protein
MEVYFNLCLGGLNPLISKKSFSRWEKLGEEKVYSPACHGEALCEDGRCLG